MNDAVGFLGEVDELLLTQAEARRGEITVVLDDLGGHNGEST